MPTKSHSQSFQSPSECPRPYLSDNRTQHLRLKLIYVRKKKKTTGNIFNIKSLKVFSPIERKKKKKRIALTHAGKFNTVLEVRANRRGDKERHPIWKGRNTIIYLQLT